MSQTNLKNPMEEVVSTTDNIVIVKVTHDIAGGRSLDVNGITATTIKAGHVIIKDADGNYKPMPTVADGSAYDTMPANSTIEGILIATIATDRAMAGIMRGGQVNQAVAPYPYTSAIKQALPLIDFIQD